MIKEFKSRKSLLIVMSLIITFAVGCGGGGGGSNPTAAPSTDYQSSIVAPNTTVLANSASIYEYSSKSEQIGIKVPVNNETAKYALVVVNTSGTSQTIKINPESYVTSMRAASVGSVRANVLTAQTSNASTDLAQRYANQTRLQNNMRKNIGLRRSSLTDGVKASMQLRASDNSSEYEGQIKTLYTISKSYGDGTPMIPRECKLVKISQYCKIFIDQEEYEGLSAVDGDYKVTNADVEHFATEFDTLIYDLLTNEYAPVYDFDNDGKFTILISPVYAKLGFAGLFNTIHLTPAEYAGTGSNQRDMVAVWSPSLGNGTLWTGETWREATRETIAHEMQHAANYSAKFWSTGSYNRSAQMEEVWLDEGLSVGVEARYRVMRSDPAGENRFDYWAENPSSTNLTQFSTLFNPFLSYGMNGLFNFYLYNQEGGQAIQNLVQSSKYGEANMDAVFADRGGLKGIFKDWSMAIMLEGLRNTVNNPGGVSLVDINQIENRYRYNQYLDLGSPSKQFAYQNLLFGQKADSKTIPNYAAAFYVLNEPANFTDDEYQFRIDSDSNKNIDIMMVRLPTP
jgi:hypothetical protein